jgi:YEATS domain-containing protein 4
LTFLFFASLYVSQGEHLKLIMGATSTDSSQQQQQQATAATVPRLPHTTICVPIVYGSIAFQLKKPDSSNNTHQWTLYLRGPNNEDLSTGIAKVVFQLHPSFPQPIRELTAPPFEVTEKGWGEFEATIRIVWRDAGEKAMVLTHVIKLYPPLPPNALPDITKENGPVKSEKYDEVVFTDPTEIFHKQLMQSGNLPKIKSQEAAVQELFKPYSDENDFKILLEAQKFIEAELQAVKDRILKADSAKVELDEALAVVANQNKPVVNVNGAPSPAAVPSGSTGIKRKSSKSAGSSKRAKT